jgi:mRNA-degrading endonuclease RelE of RelBE toxin-antitoxin system
MKSSYSKEADKFLKENKGNISEDEVDALVILAVKKILRIDDSSIDLKKLKGKYRGSFRIRRGDTRIIFTIKKEALLTVFVHDIAFRGNVYK